MRRPARPGGRPATGTVTFLVAGPDSACHRPAAAIRAAAPKAAMTLALMGAKKTSSSGKLISTKAAQKPRAVEPAQAQRRLLCEPMDASRKAMTPSHDASGLAGNKR